MIDTPLYAKLPPTLKRSVDMARLKNATYDKIDMHLERKFELNELGEGEDVPVSTKSTAPATSCPGCGLLSSGKDQWTDCNYCKKPGHIKDNCRTLQRKEEAKRKDVVKST